MLVENEAAAAPRDGWATPNAEAEAGKELQRLRKARDWTQEEVARRMRVYGYSWNQTMISKIEAGTRPLRVNELADFADLYGAPVSQLMTPQMSLQEAETELGDLEPTLEAAAAKATAAEDALTVAEGDLKRAKQVRDRALVDLRRLQQRLDFLRQRRDSLS